MVNVYGYCPQCGAPGQVRERRPNGNDRCEKGHWYPSATAKATAKLSPVTNGSPSDSNASYREALEAPLSLLDNALREFGVADEMPDHELIDTAARKLRMLHEMVLAAGLSKGLLKAAMAS